MKLEINLMNVVPSLHGKAKQKCRVIHYTYQPDISGKSNSGELVCNVNHLKVKANHC